MMTTAATSGVAAPTMRPSANATTSVVPFTGDAAKVRGAVGGVVIVGAAVLFAL